MRRQMLEVQDREEDESKRAQGDRAHNSPPAWWVDAKPPNPGPALAPGSEKVPEPRKTVSIMPVEPEGVLNSCPVPMMAMDGGVVSGSSVRLLAAACGTCGTGTQSAPRAGRGRGKRRWGVGFTQGRQPARQAGLRAARQRCSVPRCISTPPPCACWMAEKRRVCVAVPSFLQNAYLKWQQGVAPLPADLLVAGGAATTQGSVAALEN